MLQCAFITKRISSQSLWISVRRSERKRAGTVYRQWHRASYLQQAHWMERKLPHLNRRSPTNSSMCATPLRSNPIFTWPMQVTISTCLPPSVKYYSKGKSWPYHILTPPQGYLSSSPPHNKPDWKYIGTHNVDLIHIGDGIWPPVQLGGRQVAMPLGPNCHVHT